MTAFDDLDSYLAIPRLSGLALSPDGSRLVTSVQTLDPKSTKYVTALWEIDPSGDLARIAEAGIDMDDVTDLLLRQGIEKFEVPMKELLESLESLGAGVVELSGLPDLECARSQHQHFP